MDILPVISAFTILIPILAMAIFGGRFEGRKTITFFIAFSCLAELFFIVTTYFKIRNLPFVHAFTLIEFIILSFLFVEILRIESRYVIILILLFSVYLIINPFIFEDLSRYNSISRSLEAIVLTLFCIAYFYKIYKEESLIYIDQQPIFWIVSGLMVYATVGLFTHLMAKYILEGNSDRLALTVNYSFANIANILKNVMISIGIWKSKQ